MWLLALYLFSLSLGGVLVAASALLGGHDAHSDVDHDVEHELELGHDLDHDVELDHDLDLDHDVELDHDLDAELDHDAEAGEELVPRPAEDLLTATEAARARGGRWLPFLSLRFWTFSLATFGATGSLLRLLGLSEPAPLLAALATGLVIGLGTSYLFHALKRDTVGETLSARDLRGQEAVVLLPVEPGGRGKIRIPLEGGDLDLPAVTHERRRLERHARVLVVSAEGGVADVIALPAARRRR